MIRRIPMPDFQACTFELGYVIGFIIESHRNLEEWEKVY